MVMMKQFANAPPGALGDFARALHSTDADVLARHGCALADITCGIERVKRDKVARTFPNTLGRRSSALGRSLADISSTPAHVSTRAAWMGLPLHGRLRRVRRLRGWLGLAALRRGVLAPDKK